MATPAEVAVGAGRSEPASSGIQTFRHAHRWLLIPLFITLLGFTPSYFLKLGEATWHQHLHGISATLWFVLLIVQPWLATHGRLAQHRVIGPVGLLLAGMVVASALGVIPANIENALIEFVVVATFPIIAAIAAVMIRLRRAHPALILALIGNLLAFLVAWLGDNETWRAIATAMFM